MENEESDERLESGHDMEVVDRQTVLESRGASAVTKACQDEGCNFRVNSIEVNGAVPETIPELETLAWELYQSFRDDPRRIGYMTLSMLLGGDAPLPAVDYIAVAVDIGVDDAEMGHERSKEELLQTLPSLRSEG